MSPLAICAQCFCGTYSIDNSRFIAKALTQQDREEGTFNIVYNDGSKQRTLVTIVEDPKFEFVFDEYERDIYRGTFYFTKAWKGKPLEGYYIRAKDKKKLRVKFLNE